MVAPPCSSSNAWPLVFKLIVSSCIDVYIFLYIPNCDLFSYCNTFCVFAFGSDHLKVYYQLVCPPHPQPPSVACASLLRLRPRGLLSIQFGLFLAVLLVVLTLELNTLMGLAGVSSNLTRRHDLTANSLILYLSESSCPLL